jgi:predicted lipoprotein
MRKAVFILTGLLLAFTACKKDPTEPSAQDFDKGTLLVNVADNMIIPAITAFDQEVADLQAAYISFASAPDATGLENVRNEWREAYLAWQAAKIYDFGPMLNNGLKAAVCTYPADTTVILNNISAGSYSLGSAANADAVGLPALDFLLYRVGALSDFTSNANYLTYGTDLIVKLKGESELLRNEWNTYRATFVGSTGTESTSGFSMLVNVFNQDYELAKNAKLGIPLGVQSLGIPLPEYIEAKYSGISFELLHESIVQLHKLYNGNALVSGADGSGFNDYLEHLGRSSLSNTINANFNSIKSSINSFSGTLEEEMSSNPSGLDQLYNQIAGNVVYLKTDMTSAFGVLITYQDSDGD